MTTLLQGWNFMRLFRLTIGIFILAQGIIDQDWLLTGLGGFFSLTTILNIGCCAGGACYTPIQENSEPTKEISYEEIK